MEERGHRAGRGVRRGTPLIHRLFRICRQVEQRVRYVHRRFMGDRVFKRECHVRFRRRQLLGCDVRALQTTQRAREDDVRAAFDVGEVLRCAEGDELSGDVPFAGAGLREVAGGTGRPFLRWHGGGMTIWRRNDAGDLCVCVGTVAAL